MAANDGPATGNYAELRRRLSERGIFERQIAFYVLSILATLGLLAASVLLLLAGSPPLRLLAAPMLAIFYTNVAYIVHDSGHRQIFGSPRQNDIVMLIAGFFVGSSRSWWFETHNRHHSNPNDLDRDPNTFLPVLAFSEEQALNRSGLLRAATRFQVFYFFPLLALEGFGIRVASIKVLLSGKSKYPLAEALAIAVHLLAYGALVFYALPTMQAVAFILVHQGLSGFYMGMVFAPNHKGMLVADPANPLDFLHRQILASRNIKPSPLVDFVFGGLNYQIEHHLFPTIPRNKLNEARSVVKGFCREFAIPYHETGVVESYVEVMQYFHRMAAPLRQSPPNSERADRRRFLRPAQQIESLAAVHVERVKVTSEPGSSVVAEPESASSTR